MTRQDLLHLGLLAAIVLSSALCPCTAEAGSTVYVAGSGEEFGTLNLTTGQFTSIGTLNLPGGDTISGMGFGANGNLYGVDLQTDAHLWQINVNSASVTDLGAIGMSAVGAGADASGKLYVLNVDTTSTIFYTMNPPSLTTNVVGPTGIPGDGLFAPNAAGTQIFASAVSSTGSDVLYSINPTTGTATLVGTTGFFPLTGVFVDGTLYGFDSSVNAIITLNTSTGAGTKVATYSLPNGDLILAAAAVPEPSSVVLGLFGTVLAGSFGLIRHRRRTSTRADGCAA